MENGFHKQLWEAHSYTDDSVTFTYMSPDGECGYPGNLQVSLTYTLTSGGSLIISCEAISDQTTLLNITNHTYFNLGGTGSHDLLNTLVQINADTYTPVRAGTIPTGELRPVAGTAFDSRKEKPIGQDIFAEDEQLQIVSGGYDHNFMIRGANCGVRKAATAYLPRTGIRMNVYHDLPGLQFYTSNTTRDIIGKEGTLITRRSGFCMESHYPANAINTPGFPKPILTADTLYRTTTIYAFETE